MKLVLATMALMAFTAASAQPDKITSKGNFYYRAGQYDAAEQQYRKALLTDPQNEAALYNLSNALQKQKKYDDALKVLEQLTNTTKKSSLKAAAFYNAGVAHTQQKDLEASIEAYKNALRLDPTDSDARDNLELALQEQKKQQQQKKNQQQNQQSKMSQKEADQKLRLLSQREKELQQRLQNQSKQTGGGQALDW